MLTNIIAKVWLNSTAILKQNRQIYKFLANNFIQQYNHETVSNVPKKLTV